MFEVSPNRENKLDEDSLARSSMAEPSNIDRVEISPGFFVVSLGGCVDEHTARRLRDQALKIWRDSE